MQFCWRYSSSIQSEIILKIG